MGQNLLSHEGGAPDSGFTAPDSLWDYIEDMLGELAGLASANGAPTLATAITLAALEAARTQGKPTGDG